MHLKLLSVKFDRSGLREKEILDNIFNIDTVCMIKHVHLKSESFSNLPPQLCLEWKVFFSMETFLHLSVVLLVVGEGTGCW